HQEKVIINLNEEDEDFINNNNIWKYINVYPEQAEDTQSWKTVTLTHRSLLEPFQDENEENPGIERLKMRKIRNMNTGNDIVSIAWSEMLEDPNEIFRNSELKKVR
ncbi:13289_t:CDS:2, partial [Ambispora gerdemannii]